MIDTKICPITCLIVKDAIRAFNKHGTIMAEYVAAHKEFDWFCNKCIRNEIATDPQRDMSLCKENDFEREVQE